LTASATSLKACSAASCASVSGGTPGLRLAAAASW
jgi:hypothetical protein